MECVHQGAGAVQLPGADPEEGGLGAHRRDAFGQRERLALGRAGRAGGGVAGLGRRVGVHRLEYHPGIREGRLFGGRRGHARQPGRGVGPAAQQVEHQPPRRREEQRPGRLLTQELQRPHLPVHRLQVERLAGNLQAPQVGLQPRAGIEDVGGDLVEPGGQRPADVELVGPPVRGESGVEAVRHQLRGADALRTFHRLVRELDGTRGLTGVRPAAGERRREPRPGSRRRSCGPARRTAGPAACPARPRTGRPRPHRAPPGSTRRDRPRPGSASPPRRTAVPRSLPDRPREQRRPGRGDRGRWTSASPRLIVGFPARRAPVRAGSAAPPRHVLAAWPRPSRRCRRWTVPRCCRPPRRPGSSPGSTIAGPRDPSAPRTRS